MDRNTMQHTQQPKESAILFIFLDLKKIIFYTGHKNIKALEHVIRWQKVQYDFDFYQREFEADIAIICVSEGKSILPVSCHVFLFLEALKLSICQLKNKISMTILSEEETYF